MSIQPGQPRAITAGPQAVRYLGKSDRCDSCGAQAYVYVILAESVRLPDSGELFFCRHHAKKHWHVLRPFVSLLVDDSRFLFEDVRDTGHYIEGQEAHKPARPKYP